jgi:hypothetical protein
MNKSSFLLLPTVLAVSTSARPQASSVRTSRPQSATTLKDAKGEKRESKVSSARKPISIDFVFNVSK